MTIPQGNKLLRCENQVIGFVVGKRVAYYHEHQLIKKLIAHHLGEEVNVALLSPTAKVRSTLDYLSKSKSLVT